jgi:predicted dehydrogenase
VTTSHPSSGPDDAELRVGAIGAGGRLAAHAAGIAETGGMRLVAAFDIDEGRAREAVAASGGTPYTSLEAMLGEERLDVVTVVTPPWARTSLIVPAIEAGVSAILVEKPISLLPAEAHELVAASEGRFVAINTQYQWMPHWRAPWPRIADGLLGEIHTIRCSTQVDIIEQGPHTIDLAMTIARHAGLPPASTVRARAFDVNRYPRGERVPANLEATFALGDARLTCLHGDLGLTVGAETQDFFSILVEAIGTKGRLWVSLTQGWRLMTANGFESGPTDWEPNDHSAQTAVFEDVREHLRSGADPASFPTHVARSTAYQDMLFGAIAASLTGEEIDLSQPVDETVLTDDARWAALGAEREVA